MLVTTVSAAKTDKPIYAVFRCGEVVHVGTLALQAKGISCFGWDNNNNNNNDRLTAFDPGHPG